MSRVLTFIICRFGVQLEKPPRCAFTFLKFYKFSLKTKTKSNYLNRFLATAKARGKDAALNEKRRIPRRGSGKEENTRTHGWVTKMCAAAPDPAVILLGFMERRVWQVERGGGRQRMEVTGKSGEVIRMWAPESSACILIPALPLANLEALSLSQHLHLIRWEWQRLLSGLKDVKLLKTQHRAWYTEGTYWKQVIWTETWEKLSFRVSLRSTKFFDTPAYIGMNKMYLHGFYNQTIRLQ